MYERKNSIPQWRGEMYQKPIWLIIVICTVRGVAAVGAAARARSN